MTDKIVGILGGMGPEATIDLFSRIVARTHAKKAEDHLRIIVDNNPKMPSRQDAILKGTESPVPALCETARNLERAGANFIILAANTPHYFYDDISKAVSIPVLHIIEEAVKETIRVVPNVNKVGVIATSGAMKVGLYQKSFRKYNIQVVDVSEEVQQQIQASIESFQYDGLMSENIRPVVAAANCLVTNGAQALVMGCTEIPLILKGQDFAVPLIDPNEVTALVAVAYAKNRTTR